MSEHENVGNEVSSEDPSGEAEARRQKLSELRKRRGEQVATVPGGGAALEPGPGGGGLAKKFPRLAKIVEKRRAEGGKPGSGVGLAGKGRGGMQGKGGGGRFQGSGLAAGAQSGAGGQGGGQFPGLREKLKERIKERRGGARGDVGHAPATAKPGPNASPEELEAYKYQLESQAKQLESELERVRKELLSTSGAAGSEQQDGGGNVDMGSKS